MKRMFEKRKRWAVQHRRTGGLGKARWMTSSEHWDYGEAFEQMLATNHNEQHRVWDRQKKMEMLWPSLTYTIPPKRGLWVGVDPAERPGDKFNFKPEIWSESIVKSFHDSQVLSNMMAKTMVDNIDTKILKTLTGNV